MYHIVNLLDRHSYYSMRKILSCKLSSMASFKIFAPKYASTEFRFSFCFCDVYYSRWALLHTVFLGRMAIHKNYREGWVIL